MPQTITHIEKLTSRQQAELLARLVAEDARHGWRVISQTHTQAQLVKGKPTSHLLHLVLSIITFGLWIPIWIAVSLFAGEKQRFISVNEDGTVLRG